MEVDLQYDGSPGQLRYNSDGSHNNSAEAMEVGSESTDDERGVSKFGAIFIVCNAALGAGLLNFPYAYALAGGWRISLILQIIVMLIALVGLHYLASGARESATGTYQDVVNELCGRKFGILSMTFIMLYTFGCCITFQIVLGDQLDRVFEAVTDTDGKWYLDRRFTISIIALLTIFPLCIPRDIGFLRHAALLGFMSCLFVVAVVVTRYVVPAGDQPAPPAELPEWPTSFTSFLASIPTIFFAYQCHVSAVPIYASMNDRSPSAWLTVVGIGLILCCVVYTLTGTFGYLTFGTGVNSDILKSYPPDDPLVIAARVLMAVAMVTSYPILHFCGRAAFLSVAGLDTFTVDVPVGERFGIERKRRIIVTVVWFLSALALSITVPNISDVISVIGSLAAFFILIFPGMVIMQLVIEDYPNWHKRFKSIMQVSLGVFLIVGGTWIFGVTFTLAIINFGS